LSAYAPTVGSEPPRCCRIDGTHHHTRGPASCRPRRLEKGPRIFCPLGLSAGSIYFCGDEAQKQRWLPPMMCWEKIGCFGLTKPLVGFCDVRRNADYLSSRRRYLDPQRLEEVDWQRSTFSDINVIWARDEASARTMSVASLPTLKLSIPTKEPEAYLSGLVLINEV